MAITPFNVLDADDDPQPVGTVLDAAGNHHQTKVPYSDSRADTYTTVSAGTAINASLIPVSRFSMQVKGTGAAATAWEVVLEGGLNGTEFTTILTHKSAAGVGQAADGATVWGVTPGPLKYFRSRVITPLTLGSATNIVVNIIGETA